MQVLRDPVSRGIAPVTYRRITTLALVSLALIIVSGGAVRLTGSGLGCSDWPSCTQDRFVADLDYHQMVEFVNRVFTGAVSILVIIAVLGSVWRRPRRRDLTRWSLGLVAGVLAQIVLGGLVVIFDLTPWLVIAHFVVSMVLVWNAVILRNRAGYERGFDQPMVAPSTVWLGRALVAAAVVVVLSGTIVTGAGPHGGDENVARLPFLIHTVARVHGSLVMAFLALTLFVGWQLVASDAATAIRRRYTVLLAVLVAQAGIGYAQYFTGVPVLLVGLHIAGTTALLIATLTFYLGLFATREAPVPALVEHDALPAMAVAP
jgi:heme a synthase